MQLCQYDDLNLLHESHTIPEFCKHHDFDDCWDDASSIEGICIDLGLPTSCEKLEALVKTKSKTSEELISEAVMKPTKEADPNAWRVARSRGQCSAERLIYECNKCFTQMTEYENQLGRTMRLYEDSHPEELSSKADTSDITRW